MAVVVLCAQSFRRDLVRKVIMHQRSTTRALSLLRGVLSLGLLGLHWACAPQHVGTSGVPVAPLTLTVWPPTVWLGVYTAHAAEHYPIATEVIARVHDDQGRPVDGAVVTFALEPAWAQGAVLSPLQVTTHQGMARTTFSAPSTTGRVRLIARTEHRAATAVVWVESYEERLEQD